LGKSGYMRAVMHDLINNLNFMPVRENSGRYVISDSLILLEKLEIGSYSRIQIIDADAFSEDRMRNHIEYNARYLEYATGMRMEEHEITLVFVMSFRPATGFYGIIADYYASIANLNIFIVNLSDNTAIGGGRGFSRPAVEYILNNNLARTRAYNETIDIDIDKVIGREEPYTEPEHAADRPLATYSLVAVNALVWLLAMLVALITGGDYITWFGIKEPFLITAGQYWRLITPMFLHADIMHLAANSFSLFIFGQVVERLFGSRKFLVIYLISGILGNIVSFAFVPARSLGASGAVLGIGGALLYLWRMNRRVLYGRRRQYLTLVFMVIFNLLYGFGRPGIDNFAHLGGAAAGYLAAGAMGIKHFRESNNKRLLYAAVIVILSIAGILIGFARFSGYRYGGNFI
jgi:rhomboid protease GluP